MLRRVRRAREAWDNMSHEQREGQARAMGVNTALRGKLDIIQQLHDELIEGAIETQDGPSQLEGKLRSLRVLPLLDECEAKLRRVKDELKFEREPAVSLAELLRGTTRALLEAPIESVRMITKRAPSLFGAALTKWVTSAQRHGNVDTAFDETRKIRRNFSTEDKSKVDGGKRKRNEASDDDGEDGSERVGEGPSDGTSIEIRDLIGMFDGGGDAETHDTLEQDEVPGTAKFPNTTDRFQAPVSGMAAPEIQGKDVIQNNNALTSSSADHTVPLTQQNNTQATAPATSAPAAHVWSEDPPPGSRRAEWDLSDSD